ncbi:MAG: hypothetical protein QHC88_12825 [Achromobacter sp.]|uniref:hypothetical protein n=1 Tax=Achromobacter sp. TaxID=134375 RepID=UPI0029AC8E94|nr:hypothetical protein [Achromobacter sp.]MDX3986127.1 hypothetical protein [Achromobacter sp.]
MNTEWKPIPASLYDLILTGDLEALLWKLKGVREAEEIRMALYNARKAILDAEEYSDCTPAPTSHPIPTGATGEDERQPDLCPRCDGSGEITVMSDNSPDAHDVVVCCDHCQGSGAATDAAKYLAAALSGEKYRHMQLWAEYRNFHRSLCARFGYAHDPVHFRRDLVSLEEAIVAKVSAPAASDALDAQRWRFIRRKLCLTGNGDGTCAIHAINLPASVPGWPEPGPAVAEFCDAAIDAEISSQQGEGGAA